MGAGIAVDELDALIEQVSKRGFMWHQFRVDRHGPEVLAGVFQWRGYADVLVLVDDEGSHAYRMPTDANTDVFAPTHVHWWYSGARVGMVWVLRALLTLPRPDQPDGVPPLKSAPPGSGVPGNRVPVQMRRWLGR